MAVDVASEELDAQQISDEDIATIAREYLTRWEELSPYLGLTAQDEQEIRGTYRDYGDQKREALRRWRGKKGKAATYRAFIDAATKMSNAELADNVRDLARTSRQAPLGSGTSPNMPPTVRRNVSERQLITDNILDVTSYLVHLSKQEITTLGRLLGLRDVTVRDTFEGSTQSAYLDSIVSAWLKQQDDVINKGGPYWSVLVKALESLHLRQTGIATDIRKERLSR